MLTDAWTPLRYHTMQDAAWRSTARFLALACGRGSGKTELAKRRIVRFLAVNKPWADPKYFWAMPTYKQAKRVAWFDLKALIPRKWIARVHESELRISTVFGSTLYVGGLDKPERFEGVQWDGGVIDESCDIKPGAFERSILPTLVHRDGWLWRIGVPKRFGPGAREFKEFCEKAAAGEIEDGVSYTWPSADIVPPEKLAKLRAIMDPRDFAEQFDANWQDAAGRIFYAFSDCPSANVTDTAVYRPDLPITVGSDFNVDPMAWVLCHRGKDGLIVFDELWMRDANTEGALNELHRRYGNHKKGWDFFGDASSQARHSSAAESDYNQIKNDERFSPSSVYYPKKNPGRAVRFAACNALFCNAAGLRRCKIHPRCTHLRADLANRAYAEHTRETDDGPMEGHISDALGYVIHRCWPIKIKSLLGTSPAPSAVAQGF